MKKSSIKSKHLWVIMLASSVALLLACSGFVALEMVTFHSVQANHFTAIAGLLGHQCTAALDFDVPEEADRVLRSLDSEPNVLAAAVYRLDGSRFAEYQRDPKSPQVWPGAPLASGYAFQDGRLLVCQRILTEGETTGFLWLNVEMGELKKRLHQYAEIAGAVLGISWLGAFLISAFLQRWISRPILQLAHAARQVSREQDYSVRVSKETNDEIGDMVESFNDMLAEIQERDAALLRVQEQLEQRVAERTRALEDSWSMLSATLESTEDGILVVDDAGRHAHHNQKFAQMWGLPASVLDTRDDQEAMAYVLDQLEEPELFLQKVQALYADPQAVSFEEIALRDGRCFERYSQAQRVRGSYHCRVWSFRDITKRKQAEAESQRHARQQAMLAELGKLALRVEHPAELMQQAMARLTETLEVDYAKVLELQPDGESLKLIAGMGWSEGLVGTATVDAGLQSQAGFTLRQRAPVRVENSPEETRFHASPMLQDHGIISGMSVVIGNPEQPFGVLGVHTITSRAFTLEEGLFLQATAHLLATAIDRHRGERERTDMQMLLQQAQKLESIGRLAAGIAHEINTPTQYIGDNVSFLEEAFGDLDRLLAAHGQVQDAINHDSDLKAFTQQARSVAEEIDLEYLRTEIPAAIQQSLEGVGRVSLIVRAMKDFSHPGAEEKMAIDLNRAINSTITVARNEWKYVAELALDFQPSLPPVHCLPGEFNQVILNLVVNAAHAIGDVVGNSGKKGLITVSTRQEGDWIEIRIADTGKGIPAAVRDKIFDPFFTTKEVGKGTGQGLAIARAVIVDKHGGKLTFETEEGNGTTFILRLPINASAVKGERKAA